MPVCPHCSHRWGELAKPIQVTEENRETIDRAIRFVREDEEDETITEGRALELVCADFLAGAKR